MSLLTIDRMRQLRAACLTQILRTRLSLSKRRTYRHVFTASTDLLDVAIMKIYELQDLHAKAEELGRSDDRCTSHQACRDEQPELLEDLLARYITITEEIDAIAPTSDGTTSEGPSCYRRKLCGAKAFKVNSETTLSTVLSGSSSSQYLCPGLYP